MDEKPNVNNLNGIPNFGHGFPEVSEPEEVTSEEVTDEPKPKKRKASVDKE